MCVGGCDCEHESVGMWKSEDNFRCPHLPPCFRWNILEQALSITDSMMEVPFRGKTQHRDSITCQNENRDLIHPSPEFWESL